MTDLIQIKNENGQLYVSSRDVAKGLNKEHKHVQEIKNNLKKVLTM